MKKIIKNIPVGQSIAFEKGFGIHGFRFKMVLVAILASVFLIATFQFAVKSIVSTAVESMMTTRMEGDINSLSDILGSSAWHKEGNALYCGEQLIGDGTVENALLEPFIRLEMNTGSFSYVLVRCSDEELETVSDTSSQTTPGHYLRVAGSTLDNNGEMIVGTYLDKKIADVLDETNEYSGYATVVNVLEFCLYHTITDNEGSIIGVISVGHSIEDIENIIAKVCTALLFIVAAIMALVSIGLNTFFFNWSSNLQMINLRLRDISAGKFSEEPLKVKTKDELTLTVACVNEMAASLKEKQRLSVELESAAAIQEHMLPRVYPPFPGHSEFDIFAHMTPAKEVGGDFYDYFMPDENHLAFLIADVSGKGIPAALFMVKAMTLIRSFCEQSTEPAEVLAKANASLCHGNKSCMFVTSWLGILNLQTGELKYSNAGHNPPCLGRNAYSLLYSEPALPLAVMEDCQFDGCTLTLSPGDRLLLYTDGITEAQNGKDEFYGTDRLLDFLKDNAGLSVTDTLTALRRNIDMFADSREQFDDITMLMVEYGGNGVLRTFDAQVSKLDAVIDFVEEQLGDSCSIKTLTQLKIAVEELFVNIASYAYKDGGSMTLYISKQNGTATLCFTDSGVPFNPLAKPDPDVNASIDERVPGGLGIYMVKKSMDKCDYKYENGKNIFTITKALV